MLLLAAAALVEGEPDLPAGVGDAAVSSPTTGRS
jgi:hypothetical protein